MDKNYSHLSVSALQTGPIQGNNHNMTEHRKKLTVQVLEVVHIEKTGSHFVMLSRRTVLIILECKSKDTQTA